MKNIFVSILGMLSVFVAAAQDYSKSPELINAKEVIEKGVKAYDEEKYEDAISYFVQIPENDTAYPLALYEHALCYRAMKKPQESVKLLKKGLTLKTIYKRSFYEMLGSAYDEAGDFKNALNAYREGLKEFPSYDMFYNEIGIAYSNHKDGDSALANLIKAVEMNPLRATNHVKLSAFLIANNQLVPGLMSYLIFASIENNTSRSFSQLLLFEKILKKEQLLENDTALKLNFNTEQFAELEQILKSNMAVSSDYKVPVKLNYPYLIKNFHVLLEKVQPSKSNNDVWNNFYMVLLKKIFDEKKFEPFVLNIFSVVEMEDIQKQVKKNKKEIDEYQSWLIELIYKGYMKDKTTIVEGKPLTAEHSYFSNGNIKSICKVDEAKKINVGQAYFFYKNGICNAKGVYDNDGKKNGEWTYYSADGTVTSFENYRSGILDGVYQINHPNGSVRERGQYVNGKVQGEVQRFYANGSLRKVNTYNGESASGPEKEFYDNSMLKHTVTVGEGNLYNGEMKKYYSTGGLNYVAIYKQGMFDGPYKTYYELSGTITQEGTYVNDKRTGKLTDYNISGTISKVEDSYTSGKLNGSYITYHENGKVHEKGNYENDMLEGEYTVSDTNGRMYAQYFYEKNKLKKVTFFGPDNKPVDEIIGTNKRYLFKKYFETGTLYEEGYIDDNKREGLWKQYYRNGNLRQEMEYKNNNYNGIYKTYYRHGQLKSEVNYTEDQKDGLYKEYYPSGKIKQQGWYVKGEAEQHFYNYSETGKLTSDVYLFNSERQGPMKLFDINGRVANVQYYDKGILYRVETLDTLGNVIKNSENVNGTGKLAWYHFNGQLSTEIDYRNGYEHGAKKVFHNNGKIYFETTLDNGTTYGPYKTLNVYGKPIYTSYYKKDQLDSVYTQYHFDGHVSSVMNYKYGELNGLRQWFYPNGKTEVKGSYRNDERNGPFGYYAPDGTLMMQRNYTDGMFVSYTWQNASGQFLPPVSVDIKKQEIVSYYPNGKKSMQFTLVFGYLHGEYKTWYTNGNKKEEFNRYYDDYEGSQKEYYENGNLMSDEFYIDDNKNGECLYYYDTGKLKRVTNYVNGVRHGWETLYDKEGKKTSQLKFYNGEIAK